MNIYITGVKHAARGPKPALQRFQFGPRHDFMECKNYTEDMNSQGKIHLGTATQVALGLHGHLGAWQDLPDHPDRFDTVVIVVGRDGFTSGRHYWEVQVGDKDDWYLGVAKSSVNRKGRISVSTTQGYWALAMKKGQGYRASTSPPLLLALNPKPKRVGVYVDYEEGQVSFYDVKARTHIYTFNDSFTEKLLPFFYLYCCDKASDTIDKMSPLDISANCNP
uniref:B30.2/SPRY domain-containing protein n=1 Tax=Sphaeramia orbicularis TaxID=375764 RepID=A0A673CIG1_9TELE